MVKNLYKYYSLLSFVGHVIASKVLVFPLRPIPEFVHRKIGLSIQACGSIEGVSVHSGKSLTYQETFYELSLKVKEARRNRHPPYSADVLLGLLAP